MAQAQAKASRTSFETVRTEGGVRTAAEHTRDRADAEQAAKDRRANRVSNHLHNVYQVDYVIRPAEVAEPKRGRGREARGRDGEVIRSRDVPLGADPAHFDSTRFQAPVASRTGSIKVAAVDNDDIHAAVAAAVPVGKGEVLSVSSSRQIAQDVYAHHGSAPASAKHPKHPKHPREPKQKKHRGSVETEKE